MKWNADLPLDDCCTSLGASAGALAWDACLVSRRTERAREIEVSAVAALEWLAIRRPGEGWDEYLEWGGLRWPRIIQAGYSSGANQSAFLARMFPVAGLILLAGGGDGQGPPPVCPLDDPAKDAWDPPPALWMRSFSLPTDGNHVGLTHVDEKFNLFEGWGLDGVPDRRLDFDSRQVTSYADILPATRLVRTNPVDNGTPHGTAIDKGPEMNRVRMYLACKAGGTL